MATTTRTDRCTTCRWLTGIVCIWLLAGCASKPPQGLEPLVDETFGPGRVVVDQDGMVGRPVRWGGEIIAVSNNPDNTEIELFHRPLGADAKPKPEGGDGVRFIARVDSFLDPAVYQPGKRLAVSGTLAPGLTRNVGEFPYRYPVVATEAFHLWPAYEPPPDYRHYPYYDPWWPYGPWGPWRRHPYWW